MWLRLVMAIGYLLLGTAKVVLFYDKNKYFPHFFLYFFGLNLDSVHRVKKVAFTNQSLTKKITWTEAKVLIVH